jgi:outer membrane protein assembly factor BamA
MRHRLETNSKGSEPMREFGFFTRLETPKFLLPFSVPEFQRKFSPHTVLQLSYNSQKISYYQRTIANTSFGYTWKGNSFNRHTVFPVDFYIVKLPEGSKDTAYYNQYIKGTRQEYSFVNHTILALRYGFEFNTQSKGYNSNYIYIRSNIETAGLLVKTVNRFTDWGEDSLFFGVPYFQYIKGDFDFRHFNVISSGTRIVYRLYGGIGVPYGNSKAMPFEKMFWSGGAYGIRAWSERSLGPGSSTDTSNINNRLGDIKVEGNIEYRFKLLGKLEGGLFADAGNIWLLKQGAKDPGEFYLKDFYKEIAIGTGIGARLDLSFVLIRIDWGFKLKDPGNTEGQKWIFQNDNYKLSKTTFQFGIGYPF